MRSMIRNACAAVVAILATSPVSAQSLDYQRTTLVHGLAGTSGMWRSVHPTLGASPVDFLEQRIGVALRLRGTPDLTINTRVVPARLGMQRQILSGFVAERSGRHVLVGHSMGSLVSRSIYLAEPARRSQIAAIVAVTPPHQGADISVNVARATDYFRHLDGRVNEALDEINQSSMPQLFVLYLLRPWEWREPDFYTTGFRLLRWTYGLEDLGAEFAQFDVQSAMSIAREPALMDLPPTDPKYPPAKFSAWDFSHIQRLNSDFADAAVPRANVVAQFTPTSKIPIRLMLSIQNQEHRTAELVKAVNDGIALFGGCNTAAAILLQKGRKRDCKRAKRLLENIDREWNKVIKGADTVTMTFEVAGLRITERVEVARAGATDGVVPNLRSVYPGLNDLSMQFSVRGERNHVNVYKHEDGVRTIGAAMLRVGMAQTAAEPIAPYVDLGIDGPSTVLAGMAAQWTAHPTGGRPPFRHQWSIDGSPTCVSTTNPPCAYEDFLFTRRFAEPRTFVLGLTVTDASGVGRVASRTITVAPSSVQLALSGPADATVGTSSTWYATTTGGTPPFRYDWSVGPSMTTSERSVQLAYAPTSAGTLTVTVKVTDAAGATGTASATTYVRSRSTMN